jgi:hypothetical protein
MVALEVSARQFREKQKSFFDLADSGRQIIIRRGSKQAYFLAPVEKGDFIVTDELLTKLENIRQRVKEGEYTECKTVEEALNHLESL